MRSSAMRSIRYLALTAGLVGALGVVHARKVHGAGHDEMGGHMRMTALRPVEPGDQERAAAIVTAARKAADQYTDYHKALADGYEIFLPGVKQNVYHFTNNADAFDRTLRFDAAHPTSLLYERTPAKKGEEPGYKLLGVMYTAPFQVSEDDLNRRIPLSIARWHLHTNLCLPPDAGKADVARVDPKFGLAGSITTAADCQAAGGRFMPHLFGWMMHVYPYETDQAKVWAAGMDDEHGMQHDPMADMPM